MQTIKWQTNSITTLIFHPWALTTLPPKTPSLLSPPDLAPSSASQDDGWKVEPVGAEGPGERISQQFVAQEERGPEAWAWRGGGVGGQEKKASDHLHFSHTHTHTHTHTDTPHSEVVSPSKKGSETSKFRIVAWIEMYLNKIEKKLLYKNFPLERNLPNSDNEMTLLKSSKPCVTGWLVVSGSHFVVAKKYLSHSQRACLISKRIHCKYCLVRKSLAKDDTVRG